MKEIQSNEERVNELIQQAERLHESGYPNEANTLLSEAISISRDLVSSWRPETAKTLNSLALAYQDKSEYGRAEALYLRALEIALALPAPDNMISILIIGNLALLFHEKGAHAQAEPLYIQALNILMAAAGSHAPHADKIIMNLAKLYEEQERYNEAEPLYIQALEIRRHTLQAEDPAIMTTLHRLAMVYECQGKYVQANEFFEEELIIARNKLGPTHQHVAAILNNIACIYLKLGNDREAELHCRESLAIRQEVLGSDHPDTAQSLDNLASALRSQENYLEAKRLCQLSLEIYKKTLGLEHPETATALENLAHLHRKLGEYEQARQLLRRSLRTRRAALGPNHPETALSVNHLGLLSRIQGDRAQAQAFYEESLNILVQSLGRKHPFLIAPLNNLATIYRHLGDYSKAKEFYKESLEVSQVTLGLEHSLTIRILVNLAWLYLYMGLEHEAKAVCMKVSKACENALTPCHSDLASNFICLARLYFNQGKNGQAEELLQHSLRIYRKTLGVEHPSAAACMLELAKLYLAVGNYGSSMSSIEELSKAQREYLMREIPLLPSRLRRLYMHQLASVRDPVFSLALLYPPAVELALKVRLERHGLLQEIERVQLRLGRLSNNSRDLVKKLSNLIMNLSSATLTHDSRVALQEKRDELEREVFNKISDLDLHPCEIVNIAEALPLDGVLIEVEHVEAIDRYIAILLKPDASTELLDLGSSNEKNILIQEGLAAASAGFADAEEYWCAISRGLIQPLIERLHGVRHWFLCVDGALHRLPFAALPWPNADSEWLSERIVLTLLSSGRDLLQLQKPVKSTGQCLVVACPSYDLDRQESARLCAQPSEEPGAYIRSRDMPSLKHWMALPETAKEGRALSTLLNARLLLKGEATTLNLLRAEHPKILHVATHGYFLPDQSAPANLSSFPHEEVEELLTQLHGEDPMIRSGLVLAGANRPHADSEDDGYLTALEATRLNLYGTELVCLSACDTGRGDIQRGEGVYGLQRALIVAGARSMLLSLWKVPDDATCEFMVRFYTLLKQGAGRYEALVAVQREFRNHSNPIWRDIYYWGAWQLIGDWRPIDGL